MSIISKGPLRIDWEAVETIKKWLEDTLDEEDLNVPIKIGSLARKTRAIARITPRSNQPYLEEYVLKPLESKGFCKIDAEKREVTFLKLIK